MTFVYKLDPYTLEIRQNCKNELPTLRLSKVHVRRTYIQTDTTEITYHATRKWSVNDRWKIKDLIRRYVVIICFTFTFAVT